MYISTGIGLEFELPVILMCGLGCFVTVAVVTLRIGSDKSSICIDSVELITNSNVLPIV